MELWILFAVLSSITGGLYSFTVKVAAEKHYNPAKLMFYTYSISAIIGLIYGIIFNVSFFDNFYYAILFAGLNVLTYYFGITTRILSLKNIDTAIYFPIYKTLGPILLLFVSFFIFNESLNLNEWIGIIIGIMVPLLLITRTEEKRQKNLKIGLIFLIIGTIFTALATTFSKQYVEMGFNILLLVFYSQVIGTIIGITDIYISKKRHIRNKYTNKGLLKLGFIAAIFNITTFYFFSQALVGNVAIVFTINSFSILVTILLSVLIYKEHFNLRKALAVVLSIAAVLFFI